MLIFSKKKSLYFEICKIWFSAIIYLLQQYGFPLIIKYC